MIPLDYHATTPLRPEAREAMLAAPGGNPASAHSAGRQARRVLEDAREQVGALLGASPDEVVFTSGATEANNLAVFGLAFNPSPGPSPKRRGEESPGSAPPSLLGKGVGGLGDAAHLLAAPLEHPCVVEPLRHLAAHGFAVEWLPVSPRGQVAQPDVLARTRPDTRLVALMLANHETGALQPVRHVAKTLPKHVPIHCDAAQAVGKIPVHFRDLGAATLAASAHKFGGPVGVGLLLVRSGVTLAPRTFGGHQQRGRRPGTEPVPLAAGLAAALAAAVKELDATRRHLDALRLRLLDHLRAAGPVVVNGPPPGDPDGLPTALNVSFPGCRADVLVMALDLAGVACSTGSACSSGSQLPSPVLAAMGVPDDVLRSAVRFTLGPGLTEADIDDAARRIAACAAKARAA